MRLHYLPIMTVELAPIPSIQAGCPYQHEGFPGGSDGKEAACNAGDLGSIPGLGRPPGEGKGYPLQYSGLENPMDCSPWGRKESDTTELCHLQILDLLHLQTLESKLPCRRSYNYKCLLILHICKLLKKSVT